jgi:hypothetical protein
MAATLSACRASAMIASNVPSRVSLLAGLLPVILACTVALAQSRDADAQRGGAAAGAGSTIHMLARPTALQEQTFALLSVPPLCVQ